MKLIDDFFHILDAHTSDDSYVCKVKLHAEHPIYSVHFPDNPVTPGVCLLQIATELLEQKYGKKLLLSKAKSIKFKKIIGPDEQPIFTFTKQVLAEGLFSVNVSIDVDETQCAVMSLLFTVL